MRVITAPDYVNFQKQEKSLFLGGGISNCPNWQQEAIDKFDKQLMRYNILLINPRRTHMDLKDKKQEKLQIHWEFEMLQRVDVILFWFPKETLCPITLYELGFQMGLLYNAEFSAMPLREAKLVVGCHPEYQRKRDVEIQVSLVESNITVHTSLDETIREAAKYLIS
jgi:hypothetical protein